MFLSTTRSHNIARLSLRMTMAFGLLVGLSGCDYVKSMMAPRPPEELREEGVALGAGCRQAGQTLEECYSLNPKSLKSGIYAGWKEMHEYMAAMNIQSPAEQAQEAKTGTLVQQITDPKQDPGANAPKDDVQAQIAANREKREALRAQEDKARKERSAQRAKQRQAEENRQAARVNPS